MRVAFEPSLAGKAVVFKFRFFTAHEKDKDGKRHNGAPTLHSTSAIL
jgi:hypothetical protein